MNILGKACDICHKEKTEKVKAIEPGLEMVFPDWKRIGFSMWFKEKPNQMGTSAEILDFKDICPKCLNKIFKKAGCLGSPVEVFFKEVAKKFWNEVFSI